MEIEENKIKPQTLTEQLRSMSIKAKENKTQTFTYKEDEEAKINKLEKGLSIRDSRTNKRWNVIKVGRRYAYLLSNTALPTSEPCKIEIEQIKRDFRVVNK